MTIRSIGISAHHADIDDVQFKIKSKRVPIPGHDALPRMFFVGLWIGARGGGKTYSCAHLLKLYEHFGIYFGGQSCAQRIVLMSPTVEANPAWRELKHLDFDADVHGSYSDAKLVEVVEEIKAEARKTETWVRRTRTWDRCVRKHPSTISRKDWAVLAETGNMDPRETTPRPKFEKPVVTFLVLDDLVGSSAFKSVGVSALTNLTLRNRHVNICVCILAQTLKSIPKSIRTNANVFVLFKFANMKVIVDDLYEEVSNLVTEEEFVDLYKYATEEDHGSLIIDQSQPDKANRFKESWSTVLEFFSGR